MSVRRLRVMAGALLGLVLALVFAVAGPPASAQDQPGSGYWMLDADGNVYDFGEAQHLGAPGVSPAVDIEATPSGDGYYVLQPDGTVWEYGDAAVLPDLPRPAAGDSWTTITSTLSGDGYWVFSARGCVAVRGDAVDHGSMCDIPLNAPVVGSAVTPGGNGYWMVAEDGGIFSFGDAQFHGSTGSMLLNEPVTGMAPAPGGNGYWLVAQDGGIFTFGEGLPFYGSMGGKPLNEPVVGMVTSPTGGGYLMVASDGGIFAFGDVVFRGSLGGNPPAAPVVAVTPLPQQEPGPVEPAIELERLNAEVVTVGDTWGYTATVVQGDVESLAINFRRPNGEASSDALAEQPDGSWRLELTVGGSWMAGTYEVTGMTLNGQTMPVANAAALGFTIAVDAPPPPPGDPVVAVERIHAETVTAGDTWGYLAEVVQGEVETLAIDFQRPDGAAASNALYQRADGLWQIRQPVGESWMLGTYTVTGVTINGVTAPLAGAENLGFTVAAVSPAGELAV